MHEGLPWYAMELLSGEPLSDYNRRAWTKIEGAYPDEVDTRMERLADAPAAAEAPLAPVKRQAAAGRLELVLTILRQLCASLAFLHGEGIVHRDLKSANVFLRKDETPVLIDFGLVWRFPGSIGREILDVSAAAAGTEGYMAPEQILGELVDARADLYAAGCILYETITGRLPHRSRALLRTGAPPLPPSHVVDGVPPGLDDLVMRLLEPRARD